MSQERERERRYRNLLAFSLLEVLIVIAIIAILSTLIVIRWRDMKKNEEIRQCRANILEFVSALEAYKVSNDFLPNKYWNNSGSICATNIVRSFTQSYNLPFPTCPLGTIGQLKGELIPMTQNGIKGYYSTSIRHFWTATSWKNADEVSYFICLYNNNYTIYCEIHNSSVIGEGANVNNAQCNIFNKPSGRRTAYSSLQHGFLEDM